MLATAKEAIKEALKLIILASSLEQNIANKRDLLNLLEVFRDFTKQGRVKKSSANYLATQVSKLSKASRLIS